MKRLVARALLAAVLILQGLLTEGGDSKEKARTSERNALERQRQDSTPLRCIAFSPYVAGYDPTRRAHPPRKLIDQLLAELTRQNDFRCIMTYDAVQGIKSVFPAARAKGLKVISIIWLGQDERENGRQIAAGIRAGRDYPDTIIRFSCGSEVRTRHGKSLDSAIASCMKQLGDSVLQPVGIVDSWWEVCDRSWPCQRSALFINAEWIGANVYPWWENKFSGLFPCTKAEKAADFQIERLGNVMDVYPGKEVILTEFGWPAGPKGYAEKCGKASEPNQSRVVKDTLNRLDALGLPGVVFEAFREDWKLNSEGGVGPFWGICKGGSPYHCKTVYRRDR